MAGLVVCDICNSNGGRFQSAVVKVSAHAIDRSTVTSIEQIDACNEHIQTAVVSLWDAHKVVPNLHDIRIVKV